MILIDNYDSFTYNIVQYLRELGVNPRVFKNDEITVDELKKIELSDDFSSIIISPGPKNPDEAGISLAVIEEFYKTKKILGICLGHQCIAQYFGGKIIKDKEPTHGKVSKIYFTPDALFEGLEQGFEATRYHSLIVENESLPECILSIAYANPSPNFSDTHSSHRKIPSPSRPHSGGGEDEIYSRLTSHVSPVLMAIKHKDYPVCGVQFHPEAILTQGGKKLLGNFVRL